MNVLDTTQLLNTPIFAVYNNSIGINSRLRAETAGPGAVQRRPVVSDRNLFGLVRRLRLRAPSSSSRRTRTYRAYPASRSFHSKTTARPSISTAAYTHRFGGHKLWYATLQANYGSGFPVQFQDANVNLNGTLPAHTTFDYRGPGTHARAPGRRSGPGALAPGTQPAQPSVRHQGRKRLQHNADLQWNQLPAAPDGAVLGRMRVAAQIATALPLAALRA